jgi:hypothetical protein
MAGLTLPSGGVSLSWTIMPSRDSGSIRCCRRSMSNRRTSCLDIRSFVSSTMDFVIRRYAYGWRSIVVGIGMCFGSSIRGKRRSRLTPRRLSVVRRNGCPRHGLIPLPVNGFLCLKPTVPQPHCRPSSRRGWDVRFGTPIIRLPDTSRSRMHCWRPWHGRRTGKGWNKIPI